MTKAVRQKPAEQLADGRVYVARDTEAFRLWDAWWRRTKGVCAPHLPDGRGWYFPTKLPPVPDAVPHWQDRGLS